MTGLRAHCARPPGQRQPAGRVQHFAARALLFDAAHPPRRVFLVRSGWVQISMGQKAIVDCLGPGQFFGERCLLSAPAGDLAARALTSLTVTAFDRSQLLDRMQTDRRFALGVLKGLALRTQRYEQSIADFVADRAEIRLVRLLARTLPSKPAAGWVRIPYELSHRALAKTVGTSRWRISLFMRHFQESGWLRREDGLWIDREALQRFLDQL